MAPANYKKSHDLCRKIVRAFPGSLYFASRFLPSPKKRAVYALLSFYLLAEGGLNGSGDPGEKKLHLQRCKDLLDRVFGHRSSAYVHDIEPALEQAISRYAIPRPLLDDVLSGVTKKGHFRKFKNEEELLEYCYLNGGCLGHIMHLILNELKSDQHEGLTALGDLVLISQMAQRPRNFIPLDWVDELDLAEHELAVEPSLQSGSAASRKLSLVQGRFVRLAENLSAQVWSRLSSYPADGTQLSLTLMIMAHDRIIEKIKQRGVLAVFEPQKLSFIDKLMIFPRLYNAQSERFS